MRIEVYCPPMFIYAAGPRIKRTAAEPMRVTVEGVGVLTVTIPPTSVKKLGWLNWLVDACRGSTPIHDAIAMTADLPPEPTVWDWRRMTVVAKAIPVVHTLLLEDPVRYGTVTYQGTVIYPDCPIEWWKNPMVATEFTVAGELTRKT